MVDQEKDSSMEMNPGDDMISSENSEQEGSLFESADVPPKQVLVTDEELKKLQQEAIEYKDKYLRLLADTENARKRMQKERQEMTRYATESLIVEFLSPLDNFENALRFAQDMSDEVKNWAFGFQMILTQFKDILTQNGVNPIESVGKPFNAHDHEAVEMVESDTHSNNTVTEEFVRGYRMGEKTIRPARVKVAKAKEKQ